MNRLPPDAELTSNPLIDIKAKIEEEELSRKTLFRTMICFLINHGYNVALINGLEWQDTKVILVHPFHNCTSN